MHEQAIIVCSAMGSGAWGVGRGAWGVERGTLTIFVSPLPLPTPHTPTPRYHASGARSSSRPHLPSLGIRLFPSVAAGSHDRRARAARLARGDADRRRE